MAHSLTENVTTICVVGITGEGKSTLGNALCGANIFKTSSGLKSETQECSHKDFDVEGKQYRVIDTIGLQDTNLSIADLHNRFCGFADLAPDGVDTFLFITKCGRFKPESSNAFTTFQEACSEAALDYTALVFTGIGDEQSHEEFVDDFFGMASTIPNLQKCVVRAGNRVLGVENKCGQELKEKGRTLILSLVKELQAKNQNQRYSNQQLQEAQQWRTRIEEEAQSLDNVTNQNLVMAELRERFHGRRERSDVEAKLQEVKNEEARLRELKHQADLAQQNAALEAQKAREAQQKAEEEQRKAKAALETQKALEAQLKVEKERNEIAEQRARAERQAAEQQRQEERLRRSWTIDREFTVEARNRQEISKKVKRGDFVKWSYRLEKSNHSDLDIEFGIKFVPADGYDDEEQVWDSARSAKKNESGTQRVDENGKLVFVFSNAYSIFTPKTIQFNAKNSPR